ncbi:hypothetical protein [Kitasatospora viridis]|uniref:Uncharacterized protein n=1 Tax=Kitasatospora viridis TaxID=281105 RepID=A0A561ULZ9_9ACTN|nr:hypothetical protein [Kitasatospora viridis]TWG00357.1 hypothetical protein FHX73_114232 [Kitasatospora viridis]
MDRPRRLWLLVSALPAAPIALLLGVPIVRRACFGGDRAPWLVVSGALWVLLLAALRLTLDGRSARVRWGAPAVLGLAALALGLADHALGPLPVGCYGDVR